ncbi:hypothetical protein GH714_005398 [Hevea brasiliensis]|uniref:Uncharacterized protein n=1 Tax=Hevea brasiliensis TaxID=3981 RepID=A0A6A6KAX5_HEVBR|nr:hypothetical protein GH714_005398 [Hevea brasiliensis]
MVTVDEKYLRRCLELIHISASKAAPSNISLNLGWGEMGILSDGLSPAKIETENTCDFTRFHFDCPLAPGNGSVVISPAGHWIVGSIMGSKSMVNILNSPLFHKYGAYDGDANYEKVSFSDVDGSTCYDFMNSPVVIISLCPCYSRNAPMHVEGGSPHFVFSLDDQKMVYVANLWKVESADDKAVDYTYLFHLRMGGQKEHEIHDSDSHLVGKMKVSTSFTLCPNKSRIMEREFVLFGGNENLLRMQTSSHDLKKSKGLSKKVAEVFRSSHSMKKRNTSRFSGSSAIMESCPWEPFQDTDNNVDALCGPNLLENHLPPNLELVAIVVKDHLPDNHQEKVGGWGLKFLKKSSVKQTDDLMESSQPHACSMRDTGDCSTSMDVLIPAGLHGGPRARNGGPSSLIERWRSGGCCDCGGWDLGCPLTVLKKRLSNKELSPQADIQGECKLVDLIIQSTLSALQAFSIAVAFIHTQSPAFRPQNVQG